MQFLLGSNEWLEPKFRTSASASLAEITFEQQNDSSSAAPLSETSHDDRKARFLGRYPSMNALDSCQDLMCLISLSKGLVHHVSPIPIFHLYEMPFKYVL